MKLHENNSWGELGGVIAKGLLAGLAATAAITISQIIEMKITKRKPGEATLKVAEETAGLKPASADDKQKLSQEIHWSYGTVWGISRGLISLTGLKGIPATLIHFGAIWGASMVILPKFKAAPPVYKEDAKAIVIDGFHHAVYAVTAGLVFDALDAGSKNEKRFNRLMKKLHLKGLISRFKF
jgi:hypothetical protein